MRDKVTHKGIRLTEVRTSLRVSEAYPDIGKFFKTSTYTFPLIFLFLFPHVMAGLGKKEIITRKCSFSNGRRTRILPIRHRYMNSVSTPEKELNFSKNKGAIPQ